MNCKNKTVDELKDIFDKSNIKKLEQCLKTLKNSINMKSLLTNELNAKGYVINPASNYREYDDAKRGYNIMMKEKYIEV